MGVEHAFHLEREDLHATDVDDVLDATEQADPPMLVTAGAVPGTEESPHQDLLAPTPGLQIGIQHPRTGDREFAGTVRRDGLAILSQDGDLIIGQRCAELTRLFADKPRAEERQAHFDDAQALAHPNWDMGPKISIDSATMMNKGLEIIEASYLFGMPAERIGVLIHPQSVVHSMVEYADGSTLAQLGAPDMRAPIACAWSWPGRLTWPAPKLDLADIASLTFQSPDETLFPALKIARNCLSAGGGAPAAMNAANEVAVAAFLADRIRFLEIADVVSASLEAMNDAGALAAAANDDEAVEWALMTDASARRVSAQVLSRFACRN